MRHPAPFSIMIAFIEPPEKPRRSPTLERVHHLLAATLLPAAEGGDSIRPVAGWKVWLLAGWLTAAALWSVVYIVGNLL